jgi:hypothetical protein
MLHYRLFSTRQFLLLRTVYELFSHRPASALLFVSPVQLSGSKKNPRAAQSKLISMLVIILFVNYSGNAQSGFGIDVGYATSNAVNMNLKYYRDQHVFAAGGTFQFNDARGKKVKDQRSGFGRTVSGTGDFFYTADIGYSYRMKNRFSIGGELSFGTRNYYTEYSDNRFTGGGYHMVHRSRFLFGAGVLTAYEIDDMFGIFAGYNTVRAVSAGLQIRFIK